MRVRSLLLSMMLIFPIACGDDDDATDDDDDENRAGTTSAAGNAGRAGGGRGGGIATGGAGGNVVGTSGGGLGGVAGQGLAGAGALAGGGNASGAAGEGGTGGAPAELTDGQVLEIFDTANLGEIEQGQIARGRAESPAVQEFAEMIIDHHTAAHEKGEMLAEDEGMTLEATAMSRALQAASEAIVQTLEDAPDATFDRVYIDSQVTVHREVLTMLDEQLIPEADTDAVEQLLIEGRATVAEHLETAEDIADSLD